MLEKYKKEMVSVTYSTFEILFYYYCSFFAINLTDSQFATFSFLLALRQDQLA